MITSKQMAFKGQLIKKLHTLKSSLGLSDDQYRAALASFHEAEHSTDLSIEELIRLIDLIQRIDPEEDMWRKRVMAAIGSYLRSVSMEKSNSILNSRYIKGIACNATGYKSFNRIPTSRLRDLYYEFTKKSKVVEKSNLITKEIADYQTFSN